MKNKQSRLFFSYGLIITIIAFLLIIGGFVNEDILDKQYEDCQGTDGAMKRYRDPDFDQQCEQIQETLMNNYHVAPLGMILIIDGIFNLALGVERHISKIKKKHPKVYFIDSLPLNICLLLMIYYLNLLWFAQGTRSIIVNSILIILHTIFPLAVLWMLIKTRQRWRKKYKLNSSLRATFLDSRFFVVCTLLVYGLFLLIWINELYAYTAIFLIPLILTLFIYIFHNKLKKYGISWDPPTNKNEVEK